MAVDQHGYLLVPSFLNSHPMKFWCSYPQELVLGLSLFINQWAGLQLPEDSEIVVYADTL